MARPLRTPLRPLPGWECIRHLDQREVNGQRAGQLHPWETKRIREGDLSPIFRELEPELEEGSIHVISWSRPRRYVDRDTGGVLEPPATPAMWVVLGKRVRKARGGWSVPIAEVVDKRIRQRYIRRKPPVLALAEDVGPEEAHEQSNYQATPIGAVDEHNAVDDEDLAIFSGEAAVKRLLADRGDVEERLAQIKRLPARTRIVELHKLASDRGIDVRDDLRAFERRLRRRLDDAA